MPSLIATAFDNVLVGNFTLAEMNAGQMVAPRPFIAIVSDGGVDLTGIHFGLRLTAPADAPNVLPRVLIAHNVAVVEPGNDPTLGLDNQLGGLSISANPASRFIRSYFRRIQNPTLDFSYEFFWPRRLLAGQRHTVAMIVDTAGAMTGDLLPYFLVNSRRISGPNSPILRKALG